MVSYNHCLTFCYCFDSAYLFCPSMAQILMISTLVSLDLFEFVPPKRKH